MYVVNSRLSEIESANFVGFRTNTCQTFVAIYAFRFCFSSQNSSFEAASIRLPHTWIALVHICIQNHFLWEIEDDTYFLSTPSIICVISNVYVATDTM